MKSIISCCLLLFMSAFLMAQPPSGKASPGSSYGTKIKSDGAIEATEVPLLLSKHDTITVKVKAKVLDACASKGCWMTLRINDSTEAMVKMKDYGFFVPIDIIGKTVVLDGKSYIRTTSVAELKHYAEDAKKSQQEIDAITKAEKQIRFMATGILVLQ